MEVSDVFLEICRVFHCFRFWQGIYDHRIHEILNVFSMVSLFARAPRNIESVKRLRFHNVFWLLMEAQEHRIRKTEAVL